VLAGVVDGPVGGVDGQAHGLAHGAAQRVVQPHHHARTLLAKGQVTGTPRQSAAAATFRRDKPGYVPTHPGLLGLRGGAERLVGEAAVGEGRARPRPGQRAHGRRHGRLALRVPRRQLTDTHSHTRQSLTGRGASMA
jgi:hypothetical protein